MKNLTIFVKRWKPVWIRACTRFKEYYGMSSGHSLSLRGLFGRKENFTVYISGKRRSLIHPNTAQRSFLPITIFFLGELKEKLA